ncbi:MAG: hypothetical protein LKM39_11355 [Chiayiivirga sp.]|nr:hypothetical protein [Chiayiivirga sp.]
MKIETLPNFTGPARKRWESIAPDFRVSLLSNVWCGTCRDTTTIANFSGRIVRADLVLEGVCAKCGDSVGRLIEGG